MSIFVTLPAAGANILVLPVSGGYLPVSALALVDGTPVDAGHPLPVTSVVTTLPPVTFAAPQHVIVDSATLGTVTVTGPIAATQSGAWSVAVSSLPSISGSVSVSNFPATQAVSAAALPLPSGAATSALQGIGLPAAFGAGGGVKIDGSGTALPVSGTVAATQSGTWTTVLGAGSAAIGTVAFASAQHVIVDSATLGTVTVSGAVTTSGTVTEANSAAILAKLVAAPALEGGNLATIATRTPALGQALAAASVPVVLPSLQAAALAQDATLTGGTLRGTVALSAGAAAIGSVSVSNFPATQPVSGTVSISGTVPVSASSLPLPTGAATSALQGGGLPSSLGTGGGLRVDGSGTALPVSGTIAVSAIAGALPAGSAVIGHVITDTGSTTAVTSLPSLPAGSAAIGSVTVTSAPTTAITAAALPLPTGAALEAGNLASILARVPALGQAAATASVPVVDSSTTTFTTTSLAIAGAQIKATPGTLFYVSFQNYSAATVNLMLFDGTAAPATGTFPILAPIIVATGASAVATVGSSGKGLTFSTGIFVVASSTTGATGYTAVVANLTLIRITASYL